METVDLDTLELKTLPETYQRAIFFKYNPQGLPTAITCLHSVEVITALIHERNKYKMAIEQIFSAPAKASSVPEMEDLLEAIHGTASAVLGRG